jgi:tetratricopeptide (TPR) repeat protein
MRKFLGLVAVAVVALAAAAPCLADELITVDGTVHQCEILSVDATGVVARGKMKSGDVVQVKVPVARIDPVCFYELRDKSIGATDGKARLDLAVWAVEQGLFSRAKIQVKKAAEADPKLLEDLEAGKYPEIREGIARGILTSAEADIAAGRFDPARQKLEILAARLSDTEAGVKSCDALRTLETKMNEAAAKKEAAEKAKLDDAARKQEDARAKLLAAVDDDYAKGRAHALDGLTEDNAGKALDLLESALGDGAAALKKLDAIDKDHADDAALLAESKARRTKTVAGMVKIRIHRADIYMWRGSLNDAKKELDEARKLDPTNPEIDAASERLLAADDDDTFETRYLRERRLSGNRFPPSVSPRGGGGRGR